MASSKAVAAARRAGSRKRAVSRSAKAGLVFPVGRIARFLKRGRYAKFIGSSAPIYMAAVLEYLAAEVLESAGYEAEGLKKQRITPRHLTFAFKLDDELDHLLGEGTISGGGVLPHIHLALMPKKKTTGASGGGGDQKGSS